jgi:hypothetical protein
MLCCVRRVLLASTITGRYQLPPPGCESPAMPASRQHAAVALQRVRYMKRGRCGFCSGGGEGCLVHRCNRHPQQLAAYLVAQADGCAGRDRHKCRCICSNSESGNMVGGCKGGCGPCKQAVGVWWAATGGQAGMVLSLPV